MTRRPRIFTFYSYKGGVGRSMALLNVAYELHARGRHILIVDLDLEAPGISGFLSRNEELVPAADDFPDVVNLLQDTLPTAQWEIAGESAPALPALIHYLRKVHLDKFAPPLNPRFRRTRFDVVCANEVNHYTERLAQLKISECNADALARLGDTLRQVFFSHTFSWAWRSEDKERPTGYDYILIDSRTGLTETGGLCVGPLSDRLVVFCGLNDQNISGTREFLNLVGVKPGTPEAGWDDADDTDRSHAIGQKPALIVATPVPHGETELKQERLDKMKAELQVAPAQMISYHPRLALWETVFCRDWRAEAITGEYRNLASLLMRMVADHPEQIQVRLVPFAPVDEKQPPDMRGIFSFGAADPGAARALVRRAEFISSLAANAEGIEAEKLTHAAGEYFQAVLTLDPNSHEALYSWGTLLFDQASKKSSGGADRLFRLAGERYAAALAIKPDMHEALNNWGYALSEQAKQKSGEEADRLFRLAEEKFAAALAIKPDKDKALYNWANTLYEQARLKSGEEADRLFRLAGEKFAAALALKPDMYEALYNWGTALFDQAKQTTGEKAEELFLAARENYEAALALEPNDGDPMYNLACWHAVRQDAPSALEWLQKARDAGWLRDAETLERDADFDGIRGDAAFQAFLASLPKQSR